MPPYQQLHPSSCTCGEHGFSLKLNDEAGFVSYVLLSKFGILNDEAPISLKCEWKFGKGNTTVFVKLKFSD